MSVLGIAVEHLKHAFKVVLQLVQGLIDTCQVRVGHLRLSGDALAPFLSKLQHHNINERKHLQSH